MSIAKPSMRESPKQKNVNITMQVYLIGALGIVTFDLFASFLVSTIFGTLGRQFQVEIFNVIANYVRSTTGTALGIAVTHALEAPQLVLFSAATVSITGNTLGDSVGALAATIVAAELGKIISREAHLNIVITPGITIISGVSTTRFMGPDVVQFMNQFGSLVETVTKIQSFTMGVLVSVLIGIALTLPISSAAIYITLSPNGLAGGTATANCYTQMIGFAVMNYREDKVDGLVTQDLGTSMLQMDNIVLNPRIWIPPTLAPMIIGPIAAMVFRPEDTPAGAGMGTCDLMGPIGTYTAMGDGTRMWMSILLMCFLPPGVLTFVLGEMLRGMEWIRNEDLKLDS